MPYTVTMAVATGLALAQTLHAQVAEHRADASLVACPEGDPIQTISLWDDPRPLEPRSNPGRTLSAIITDHDPEGDGPEKVTFLADGSAAVIVHRRTNNVSFFDPATQAITHTVAVGEYPLDVAASPDNRYLVVPNAFSDTVSVIDVATRLVVATIPVTGSQPYAVRITGDSNFAVVGVINNAVTSAFSIIDLNTLSEVRTIATSGQGVIGGWGTPETGRGGELLTQFAVSSDGRTIVLPQRSSSSTIVNLYDALIGAHLTSVDTGHVLPTAVDISPDGTTAVVSHEGSAQRITRIALPAGTVTASVATGANLFDQVVRITHDKTHAIAAILNNAIFVSLETGTVAATLATGAVGDIRLSHDGLYAFVSNFNARVIHVPSRTIVRTIPFAACTAAATSPVSYRAVALNNRFREDIHLYDINGAAGSLLGWAPTGAMPEGDAARDVAIAGSGQIAAATHIISRNAAILDLQTGAARAWVHTGDRPLGVAITPDGQYAVVANGDEPAAGGQRGTVSIIDLSTDTVVRTLVTHDRPGPVRVSPDGQRAYVVTIAGTDLVYFIQLAGANSSILSSTPSGNIGSWGAPAYTAFSGVELSHDGSIFAVAASFDDRLNLFDTATRTQIASVPVGAFPFTVAFNPAGTRAYVANGNGGSISVVNIAGANSSVIATVPVGERPYTINVDDAGQYVYVGTIALNTAQVRVIDAATNTIVATVPIGPAQARSAWLSGATLYIGATMTGGGRLLELNAAGPATALVGTTDLTGPPSSLAFSQSLGQAVLAQPGRRPEGVDVVSFLQPCYANCDGSTIPPILNVEDFTCFINRFAEGTLLPHQQQLTHYANCDQSTTPPVLNVEDFTCFINRFAQGCP
jgi:YVTN family beta-propeller protein